MRSMFSLVVCFVIWHYCSFFNVIDSAFYPSPVTIFSQMFHLFMDSDFLLNMWSSLYRLFWSAVIAIPFAIGIAMISATTKSFDQIISPVIALTFPLPKVAIYPLMLLIFGIDENSKIALITIGLFFLVFVNARLGFLKLIQSQNYEITKIYRMKRLNFFYDFLIKGAQLEILTGIKLALNYGLTLVVVSEATTSNNGLGHFIWRSWDQFKIINVYAGVFTLSLIGVISYYSLDYYIERCRKKFF